MRSVAELGGGVAGKEGQTILEGSLTAIKYGSVDLGHFGIFNGDLAAYIDVDVGFVPTRRPAMGKGSLMSMKMNKFIFITKEGLAPCRVIYVYHRARDLLLPILCPFLTKCCMNDSYSSPAWASLLDDWLVKRPLGYLFFRQTNLPKTNKTTPSNSSRFQFQTGWRVLNR